MAKYTMELPERVDDRFREIAAEDGTTKADVVRKALNLYFVARDANRRGDLVGVVDKDKRDAVKTEFVGL